MSPLVARRHILGVVFALVLLAACLVWLAFAYDFLTQRCVARCNVVDLTQPKGWEHDDGSYQWVAQIPLVVAGVAAAILATGFALTARFSSRFWFYLAVALALFDSWMILMARAVFSSYR